MFTISRVFRALVWLVSLTNKLDQEIGKLGLKVASLRRERELENAAVTISFGLVFLMNKLLRPQAESRLDTGTAYQSPLASHVSHLSFEPYHTKIP